MFGNENPLNKTLKIDNQFDINVTGVYKDLPYNSYFKELTFIGAWQLFIDKTIGWKIKNGRDFSSDFATDSSGIILNETAAKEDFIASLEQMTGLKADRAALK